MKGGIHSSVWSTKSFLYDIKEPGYKQIKKIILCELILFYYSYKNNRIHKSICHHSHTSRLFVLGTTVEIMIVNFLYFIILVPLISCPLVMHSFSYKYVFLMKFSNKKVFIRIIHFRKMSIHHANNEEKEKVINCFTIKNIIIVRSDDPNNEQLEVTVE